jgi:L-lysine 2,3-aminomutase
MQDAYMHEEPQVREARKLLAEVETFLDAMNERLGRLNGLSVRVRWNVETPEGRGSQSSPRLGFKADFPLKR